VLGGARVGYVGNVVARIGADIRPLQRGLRDAQRGLRNFGGSANPVIRSMGASTIAMGNLMAIAFAKLAATINDFTRNSIKNYNDIISANIGLSSVLNAQGKDLQEAKRFLQEYTQDGLVPINDATAAFKQLSSAGYSIKQIEQLLIQMKDASAFNRQEALSMGEAIRSASEGIKNENSIKVDNVGITRNLSLMWADYANQIGKGVASLNRYEKIQAVVNGFTEESKYFIGDAAKYSATLGGQMSALRSQTIQLSAALGSIFAPVLQTIIPYLLNFINTLKSAFTTIGSFMSVLFGTANTQGQTAKNATSAAAAQKKLGDETKKAGDKANQGLMGFDEINQLTKETADNSDEMAEGMDKVAAPAVMDNPTLGLSDETLNKIKNFRQGVIDAWQSVKDFFVNNEAIITSAVTGIAVSFSILGGVLAAPAIISAFETLYIMSLYAFDAIKLGAVALSGPVGIAIAAVGLLTAAFVYLYKTNEPFRNFVNGIWQGIKDFFVYLWQNVLVPFGQFLKGVFVSAWDAITVAASWLYENVLVPLGNFLLEFWKNVIEPLALVLFDLLAIAFDAVAQVAKSFWKNVMIPLFNFFKDLMNPLLEALGAILTFLWKFIFQPLANHIEERVTPIFKAFGVAVQFIWQEILKPFTLFLKDVLIATFNSMFEQIKIIIEDLKNVFKSLLSFIKNIFTGQWAAAWENIKDVFRGIVNTLGDIFKAPIRVIISVINSLIDKLNSLKINIPSVAVPGLGTFGGGTVGFNIPNIPQLAAGGIINSPTLAMVGEAGTEAVVPLENSGFVDNLSSSIGSAILAAMQFSTQSNSNNEVAIYIDGIKFARAIMPALDKEKSRVGTSYIVTT
jgi:phage-related protein